MMLSHFRKGGSALSSGLLQNIGSHFSRFYLSPREETHSTTVLCVRKDEDVILVADGQVTMGGTVVKPNVKKTRRIGENVVGGFAGATADAFTLFERLESKIEEHPGKGNGCHLLFQAFVVTPPSLTEQFLIVKKENGAFKFTHSLID